MKDSLGNILTAEQEAFFKNSKVVNTNGDLLVCYHGTDANFDTFDYAHINRDSKLGLGFYFTKGSALQFEYEHKLACYINLLNPISEDDPKFGEILEEENRLMKEGKTNNEILSAVVAKFGHDGVIGSDTGHSCIVAFNPNQIKSITNEAPTSSDNINEDLSTSLYSNPVNGPSFITPEGKFLRCPGDAHRSILDSKEYKGKYKDLKDFCNNTGYIRVNDGSILGWEVYITLTAKEPTEQQYKAILAYLDYLFMQRDTDGVSVDCLSKPMEFQTYEWDYTDADEIVEKIKGFYKTGKLREGYMIDDSRFDMYVTDSVYEAKNFLLNHNEPWRVFIDEKLPIYLIGRPYECTHTDMVDLARSDGYSTRIDDYDPKVVCAIYSPLDEYNFVEISDEDVLEDDYDFKYDYDDFVMYSRYQDFKNFELFNALGRGRRKKLVAREGLKEEFLETSRGERFFVAKSPYEAKNIILRGDKAYRIFYDKKHNLYLIGDHENLIHDDMITAAFENGYFPGLSKHNRYSYIDDNADNICIAIYIPADKQHTTYGAEIGEDGYDEIYVYDDGIISTRESDWSRCPLSKAMGKYKQHFEKGDWDDEKGQWIVNQVESLNESLLLEKTRQELINKSKSSDEYDSAARKGQNRWTRRKFSQIATSVRDYNRIDMDAFFKGDILEFGVKVHGETDDYVVTVLFENILHDLQQEVKSNGNKLEFKCVLRSLLKSFNSENCYVSCTCPDWKYRQSYWATVNQQNSGAPETRKPKPQGQGGTVGANVNDTKGAGCKHINLVLANADWMMKIASVINNYIKWCKENMQRNYADYIFPQVYGMKYDKAVQLSLFDDMDDEDSGLLPKPKAIYDAGEKKYTFDYEEPEKELGDIVGQTALKGRNAKGQWDKGNDYRFKKKEPAETHPEDDEDQLKLDLFPKKTKTLKEPEIEDEEEKNIRISPKNIRPGDDDEGGEE